MCVTGLRRLAQSFMEVNYKISSSEWSGTGVCARLWCQRWHNSWKVHLQKILWLDEAKFGLLNHSATVCGICRVVLKFTALALLNLLQLQSIKNWKLPSLVPRQGFTIQEVMGKWFYDGARTKAAVFCGLGRIGGLLCLEPEDGGASTVTLDSGGRWWILVTEVQLSGSSEGGSPRPSPRKLHTVTPETYVPLRLTLQTLGKKDGGNKCHHCFSFFHSLGMETACMPTCAWLTSSSRWFWKKGGKGNGTWKCSLSLPGS